MSHTQRGESLFLTWFVHSAESSFLIRHHGELRARQALLLSCGVCDQYGAAESTRDPSHFTTQSSAFDSDETD